MSTKMRKTAIAVLAGATVLSLSACGASNDTSTKSESGSSGNSGTTGKKVSITVQNIYSDSATPTYKTLHELAAQYEQDHPNVKIEFDTLNTDQQKLKLKTQAAAKEISDITMVNPAAQMEPYVKAGLFASLNDVVDKNGLKDTFQTGLLDKYSFDGNVYALPDGNNIEVVYYNKDLFSQAGISDFAKLWTSC